MNPPPGLYPSEQPRNTDSQAEIAVYMALKERLPSGWYAWHSLRLMDNDGTFGEGDFVIANPDRGLLALEVKGGLIEQRDGRWFQNGAPMKIDPLAQAHRFVGKLIHQLELGGCYPPAYGVATCFPDTAFETPPDQSDLHNTTIGKRELAWLDKALLALFDKTLPASRRARGRWLERLDYLWGHTWIPALKLGTRSELEDSDRVKLDGGQMRILQSIESNRNLLIQGGAGSGKTLVAREAAVRFAANGERVLMLCFTRALAEWLRRTCASANPQVTTLGQYALDLVRLVEPGFKEPDDIAGWRELVFRAAAEAAPRVSGAWDAIIVDEAQDLAEFDWELVFELARDNRLWVFHDPAQHFWDDRTLPNRFTAGDFFKVDLLENYRCAPAILALANRYRVAATLDSSETIIRDGISNGTIGVVQCPSESSVPDRIANEIGKLRSSGFAPNQIAIISVRGQTGARTFGMDRIGAYRLVKADDPNAAGEIVDDTFLRFKGLERPAVIVTDLNLIADRRETRMYIAITRALSTVRIVAPTNALRDDPVLASIVG